MNIWQSLVLGAVQGLTEFLPVSSSAHLVIFHHLTGAKVDVSYDVLLHFATLLAVAIYFWNDIWGMLKSFFGGLFGVCRGKEKFVSLWRKDDFFKLSCLILIGSAPTAILGFSLEKVFESFFSSLFAVGCFLLLTAALILLAEWLGKPKKDVKKTGVGEALIIGFAQGCAIAPGLSRSGTTISASLLCGLDRKLAARFSFLLAIPALLGAAVFKAKDIMELGMGEVGWGVLIVGFLAALVSGYFAIKIFMNMIQKTSIRIFAYYCLIVGFLLILRQIM